jgi:PAS domain S-box-containing protein
MVGACLILGAAGSARAAVAPGEGGQEPSEPRSILLLHAYPRLSPAVIGVDEGLRSKFGAHPQFLHYLYTEYLDLSLLDGDAPQRELRELLHRKYSARGIDVIVAAGSRALRVALHNRKVLFSGAPVVFTGVDLTGVPDLVLGGDVTGTWLRQGWAETLDLARRLQPDIQRAVVVGGTAPADLTWLTAARQQLAAAPPIAISFLSGRSVPHILEQVARLPARTIVLVGAFQRDATGQDFATRDVVAQIAGVSKVPVYVLQDHAVGGGSVGGHVVSFEAHGRMAADLALRVARGERPPPTDAGTTVSMVDWRQLRRWGLDARRLPPGTVVLFRELSAWERYRWWIVGGVTLLLLQSALIAALLVHRAWRRRAQRALAERLRFETLLSDLSASLAAGPTAEADTLIEGGLRRIVEDLDVDRATVAALQAAGEVRVTHSFTREGVTSLRAMLRGNAAPWIVSELRQGRIVRLGRSEDLPPEAAPDRQSLERFGTRSGAVVPLVVGGVVTDCLAIASVRHERAWPDDPRLRLLAAIFAGALARQRAEQAVRESEERFRRMADSAPVMVWLSRPDGHRTYVNQRWLDFTGRRLEEELGEGWMDGVHPEDRPDLVQTVTAVRAEGRPYTVEYRLHRPSLDYRWVLDHGAPQRADDGTLLGYVGSAVDVTQLRAAQRALLETDLLRSAIFGSLYGHVAALDKRGTIIAVNQAWLRFAAEHDGDPARVSLGASYLDICRAAAETGDHDARRILEALRTVLAGNGPLQLEYALRTPGGERWYEMTVEPLRRPEGGALVTHVDITRRRQAEEEAQRQREELAHVLRMTTLGELAASLAHEINQPLAAIVANAQATRRLLAAGRASRPGVTEALSDVVQDAKRASEVIRRLRALFRKEHVEPRPVDVNELVEDVVRLLRHDIERQRIALHRALARGLPLIPGDPVQLQQVLLNLLVNACEAIAATDEGAREMVIETARHGADGVAISIRDSGVGVKEGDLERIFEHFVSTKPDGLGMGLAISRSIVQAHGGHMRATANADRGLTLHVDLPGAPPAGER